MIEFNIHQDYLFLAGAIISIVIILRVVKVMSDKEKKKRKGIRIEDVGTKQKKVKEKTLFLEEKLNQVMTSDNLITIKEYRKLSSSAKGFRLLANARKLAIKDCHAFIDELEEELGSYAETKKIVELFKEIRKTNKT